jgi:hypothetical protein
MATFKIDYFELMILAENCIPPVPIARSMFFDNLTDKYYKDMSWEQRKGIFNFIRKKDKFDLNNANCKIFYYRFNPDNQYMVTCDYDVSQPNVEAFLMDEKYWINSNTYISPELINNVKKIEKEVISIS